MGRRRLKSARARPNQVAGDGGQIQVALAAAAGEVAALRGIRADKRVMVRQAIVNMFSALLRVQGGGQAADVFLEVLRSLAADGLDVEDDALYDDPTTRDTARAGSTIPESVAAAGLGAAGRVHLAPSL